MPRVCGQPRKRGNFVARSEEIKGKGEIGIGAPTRVICASYVYMCINVYMYIYVYLCIFMYVCMYVRMYVYIYIFTYMCMLTGVQRCAFVCTLSLLIQRAYAIPEWVPYLFFLFHTAKMCRQGAPGTSDRPSSQPKPAAGTSKQYLSAKVGHGTLEISPLTSMLYRAQKNVSDIQLTIAVNPVRYS